MKTSLRCAAFAVAAVCLMHIATAEPPKPDEDLWNNEVWGLKVWKPKGKPEWKFIGEGALDNYFRGEPDNIAYFLTKWPADNLSGDLQKGYPLIRMWGERYESEVANQSGTKGIAKQIFDRVVNEDFKNTKDVKETDKVMYPIGKMYQFSCYGEHRKYGGSHYLRIMVCKKDKNLWVFVVSCAPGEEKKAAAEIEGVLKSMATYEIKRK